MVFSSTVFLFLFLPLVILISLIPNRRIQNGWLLIASLVFYWWGGPSYLIILLSSLGINYVAGLAMHHFKSAQKPILALAIAVNLGILGVFKYANFFIENLNNALSAFKLNSIEHEQIMLPIGISFFTFQAISYLVDLYRKEVEVQRNFFDLALYISLFPQLIAGPIIRYHDVDQQLKNRTRSAEKFILGIERFVIGLSKKILVANTFAAVSDEIFELPPNDITTSLAVVATVAYTFHIYFDFAAYSDMAIGLGRLFGFEFKENFNFPYVAKSIQEFWRRWHISLSSWFRDYLYIPLGGNRVGNSRLYVNLFIVFLCTGFWHGASWNFVIWGLFHGLFLVVERVSLGKTLEKLKVLNKLYVLLVVMTGWIFFKAETLEMAWKVTQEFYGIFSLDFSWTEVAIYFQNDFILCLIIGFASMLGYTEKLHAWAASYFKDNTIGHWHGIRYMVLMGLLFMCMAYMSANTYSPFIYFRF
ncbi:MAG: MBOAT family protein [Bacteroidetes bacterium]|nr:MBOAT family protein [Bacteroidota bacterium]